jgi:hypothetical protein
MDKLTKSARSYLRMVADLPWPPNTASPVYRDCANYLRSLHIEFGAGAARAAIAQARAQQRDLEQAAIAFQPFGDRYDLHALSTYPPAAKPAVAETRDGRSR